MKKTTTALRRQSGKHVAYIDGENFLHRVSEILRKNQLITTKLDITYFNFRQLLQTALSVSELSIRYYGTKVRQVKTDNAQMKSYMDTVGQVQRKLRRCLHNQSISFINCGTLSLRESSRSGTDQPDIYLKEKGVDVGLAVDLILNHKAGDTVYLVSSDTDLLPAIRALKKQRVKVVYIGFSNLTHSIAQTTKDCILLREQEIIDNYQAEAPTSSRQTRKHSPKTQTASSSRHPVKAAVRSQTPATKSRSIRTRQGQPVKSSKVKPKPPLKPKVKSGVSKSPASSKPRPKPAIRPKLKPASTPTSAKRPGKTTRPLRSPVTRFKAPAAKSNQRPRRPRQQPKA